MNILCTGGAGFIGSHTCVSLLEAGHQIVIVDNFVNSKPSALDAIRQITGKDFPFYQLDCCDKEAMRRVFTENKIDGVVHFAGLKSVAESVSMPLEYYRNNLDSVLTVLELMREVGAKVFIFSSSATVYGEPDTVPLREDMPTKGCTNPYGWTKFMIEKILTGAATANPALSVVLLRYFNPIGGHDSGLLGDNPAGVPNNLLPYISRVASGKLPYLRVTGADYNTPDGTGVRDYIHVVDLARGHVLACEYALAHPGAEVINLGTGVGYSVLDIVRAFERATGVQIPYQIEPRRPGDIAENYSDPSKAKRLLGWEAAHSIEDMCRDAWRFEQTLVARGVE